MNFDKHLALLFNVFKNIAGTKDLPNVIVTIVIYLAISGMVAFGFILLSSRIDIAYVPWWIGQQAKGSIAKDAN